jgi:hypothetical protein
MRIDSWKRVLLAAILGFAAAPALAFDTELVVAPTSAKGFKLEKPGEARDYIDHTAAYVRFIPTDGKGRPFPVFISTHNYLVCPDSDKKYFLGDVKEVSGDRRSGVRVLGFFFAKPPCDKATQHLEAITGS